MHIGIRFVIIALSAGAVGLYVGRANAWPAGNAIESPRAFIQLVDDKCWWWGTRWQYGWRGYGWYACWDEAKPAAPVAIAPETVPDDAVILPEPCLRTWHDKSGNVRSRRVC